MLLIATFVSTRVEKQIWASKTAYYAAVEQLTHVGPFTILNTPYIFGLIVLVIYYTGLVTENLRRKKHFHSVIIPAYQKAMERWCKLVYCARCDGVFTSGPLPGRPGFLPAGKIKNLLYERKPDSQPEA